MKYKYGDFNKSDLINITLDRIFKTYYHHWNLSESRHPIHDNTYLITCRNPNPDHPYGEMVDGFLKFSGKFLRYIIAGREKKSILDLQPVGIFAVDYKGSRNGYASQGCGPHIHGVWVLHPKIRQEILVYMNLYQFLPRYGFHRRKIDKTEKDLREAIGYSIKGIINENGPYRNRSSQFEWVGPKHDKYNT